MKLCKMIEIYLKYDNMHIIRTINAFICINKHINSCINNMLSLFTSLFYLHHFLITRTREQTRPLSSTSFASTLPAAPVCLSTLHSPSLTFVLPVIAREERKSGESREEREETRGEFNIFFLFFSKV